MKVWGIYCHLEKREPVVTVVEATGTYAQPSGQELFRERTLEQEDWPTKLMSLRSAVGSRLAHARPDRIVIRSMDWPPVRPHDNVIRPRLQVEGMLIELCRSHTSQVQSLPGKAIGELVGIQKATFDAQAAELFGRTGSEAGTAALAALFIEEQ